MWARTGVVVADDSERHGLWKNSVAYKLSR